MTRPLLVCVLQDHFDVSRTLNAREETDMSDIISEQDDELVRLNELYTKAVHHFESGAWLDVIAVAHDPARMAKLLFEQERLRVESLRADLQIATEKRKFDLRVALRTGSATYDERVWKVRGRCEVEYDVARLRADFPDLPDGAIKTKHAIVRRKLPSYVEGCLPEYELSRNETYTVSYVGDQRWGSDDEDGE